MDAELARKLWRYDPRTGHLWWRERAQGRQMDRPAGTVKKRGRTSYREVVHQEKQYKAHRLIWLILQGTWPQREIDHINGYGLDNRFENLREATRRENGRNRKKHKNNTSGFRGVYWHKKARKYHARIKTNEKRIHIGLFNTAEEASEAYEASAKRLFGKFYSGA